MINILLIFIILVWPFGQFLQLGNVVSGVFRFQLLDLLAFTLSLAMISSRKNRDMIINHQLFRPTAIFCFSLFLSLVVQLIYQDILRLLPALFYLVRFISYLGILFAFSIYSEKKYYNYLLVSFVVYIFLGYVQYIFVPDMRFIKLLGFDDHYYRLIGTMLDPNFTGIFLTVMTIYFFMMSEKKLRWLSLSTFIGLTLTFSRSSYFSLFVSILYLVYRTKKIVYLMAIFGLCLLLLIIPKPFGEGVNLFRTYSILSRLDNQVINLQLFGKNPVFGIGFNTLKVRHDSLIPNLSSGVDNSFIFIGLTAGTIGLLSYLYFISRLWVYNNTSVFRASFLAIIVHSFANNTLFYSWTLVILFLLTSLKPTDST